jgi:hypothetical protein
LVDELDETLALYQQDTGDDVDFAEARHEAGLLRRDLEAFYLYLEEVVDGTPADPAVRHINRILRGLSRALVPINYSRQGRFVHDPAVDLPPLPDLASATTWKSLEIGSTERYLTHTQLVRGRNRVVWTLRSARALLADTRSTRPIPDHGG